MEERESINTTGEEILRERSEDIMIVDFESFSLPQCLSLFMKLGDTIKSKVESLNEDLDEKKKSFEKTCEKIHQFTTKKVRLDVGGKIFSCSLDILCREDNFFCSMFSGRFQLEQDQFDGSYFIDRSPFYFEYILDYLRSGKIKIDRLTDVELKELIEEADFYQIISLKALLEDARDPFKWDNGLNTIVKTSSNQWDFIAKSTECYCTGIHKFNIKINQCHMDRSGFVLGVFGDSNIGPGMYGSICGFGLNATTFSSFQLFEPTIIRSSNNYEMIINCEKKKVLVFSENLLCGRGNINEMMNRFGYVRIAVFLYYTGNSITITKAEV